MKGNEKLENKLGFDRVRSMVQARCATEYGRERALGEVVSVDEGEICKRLDLTDEMRLIIMFESSFPADGFVDILPFLVPLQIDSSYIDLLSIRKLRDALDTLKKIATFFKNCKPEQYPKLKDLASAIVVYPEVNRRIDTILDKFGEVRDNASPELMKIRSSIREKSGVVSRRIQSILKKAQADGIADEDASVSVRDGRVLIPVSAANKKKLNGFIYDESASGRTAFIEPVEIAELNNQIRELHFAEQREILRILVEFTDFLRPYLPELIESGRLMGEIDFIRAKALVASSMVAGKPIISRDQELKLQKARHPLLEAALKKEGKEIVPLNISLDKKGRIVLISGPNAGGKSVCLKTVGLLQYMFQWGSLIPASESSEFAIFNDIFIDIGDNQSLDNDLSTYSSHLANMREMLLHADNRTLVLIDEFGSGTEPAAGGAIAEEILSELERRGSYGVITTHYTNLKFYANNSSGVVNGAMLFDVQNIQPLFKLEIGLPGNSFAFEIARKMGLPESIVKGAEERAGSDYVNIERNLRKIAKNKRSIDERLAKIKSTDKTLESITERYEKELGNIQALRKSIIDEAHKEAKELLAETNKKIESTIKEIRESQAERERTKELRKDLDQFAGEMESPSDKDTDKMIAQKMEQLIERKKRRQKRSEEREKVAAKKRGGSQMAPQPAKEEDNKIVKGDKVKIAGSELIGEVTDISYKNNSVTISVGQIINRTTIDKLEKISSGRYKSEVAKKSAPVSRYDSFGLSERRLNFKPQIDIRGERLTEALDIVNQYIDDAIMIGMEEVKILHGKGNGILREEIRKYLKTIPGIKSFSDEDIRQGGTGITVVKFD